VHNTPVCGMTADQQDSQMGREEKRRRDCLQSAQEAG
jgi:hypothetical protein